MATPRKKAAPVPQQAPDALNTDKASFTAKLIDRIEKGKELVDRSITNVQELEANETDFYKWNDYNSEYLKQSFNNEQNEYKRGYDRVNDFIGMFGSPDRTANEKLQRLKEKIGNKVEFLERLLEKVDLLKSEVEQSTPAAIPHASSHKDNHNIFIVHGHNTAVQQSVARTLEKLGLNPIILHEQPNAGKTIIEKFEANSNVGFAIILLTDDDEGKLKTEIDLKSRARQNVVLELGYFIGKLGRDRVLPLHSEGVELPSDIHGLLYVPIDRADTWKFALVKELKAAGYSVDANSIL
ncbi:MAG: TIR domain-containing protein [Flavisolibacter sp.]